VVGRKLSEEGVLRESSGFDQRTVEEGIRDRRGGWRIPEKAERLPQIK